MRKHVFGKFLEMFEEVFPLYYTLIKVIYLADSNT